MPEMFFLPLAALPLRGVPAALAASLAAFFSFFARFLFLMSSGVCIVLKIIVTSLADVLPLAMPTLVGKSRRSLHPRRDSGTATDQEVPQTW